MKRICSTIPVIVLAMLLLGCGEREDKNSVQPHEDTAGGTSDDIKSDVAALDADARAAVEEKLAKADKLDGTTDKIVHRCAVCALGMDGKSELALEVADYTLHFCSEGCRKAFSKNVTKSILDLEIPQE
jgi:hypothetical protein